eukprot:gene364-666_t
MEQTGKIESVQTFGRKKTATAVAFCKKGTGLIKVNGSPISLLQPEILRLKAFEPILLLGSEKFANVDLRVRVKGGGTTSQIYAIRQAMAKAIVAYYQKYVDEASKREIKDILVAYDRTLLVADPRRCEPKKFGGPGARARYQKSYQSIVEIVERMYDAKKAVTLIQGSRPLNKNLFAKKSIMVILEENRKKKPKYRPYM